MDYKSAFDYEAIKKSLIDLAVKADPQALEKYGPPPDAFIDVVVAKKKDSTSFQNKYLFPPEVALKNKSAAIGDEISKVLASHKKILAGTGLEGEVYTTSEDVNIASQYGDDVYDKVKGLLQEKRRIDSYLQPGKNPDRMGLLEIFGLTGKRDITRKTVATKGTANIAGGVGSTFLGGMSYLGSGPKSDEETVAEINYLREHDDFYKTVFPEKLELGNKTVIDKGLHTAANLVGMGPEFMVAGAITSPLKATRILSYVAKNPAAKPFVENLFKLTQVPGSKGRIAKAVLHGVDNMPMFAAHSAFKSAPEDMGKAALYGAGSGLAFGIGGQLARSGGGLGTAEWLKGMAGGGAGFAAPVAMIEAIEGESLSEIGENFAANYITGMGLHAFTYRSVSGFKKGYKERTGVDLDEAMGSKEEADKFAKVMVNGGKNVQSLMKWKTLFNLKDEYFDMEKAKYEKGIASEAGQPQADGPKPPQPSTSAEEPEYKPKANTPGEGLIEYANGNELQRSSFGDVNTFIGKVLGSPDITNETRNKLPGQFLDIASKAEWVDDFVVKAKEHLSSINGIDNEQLGNNDQLLRKIYHGYKRVSGNDKRQIKRKVLAIDSDNPRLVDYNDFARSSNRNDSDIDYLSPLAEITGNRLSVVSAYKKDGKEIRMSDLTEVEVAKAAEKFQAGGLYMLPMKGDSGDMLLVEKHPLMDNKEQHDIAAKELEAHSVLDKVQDKEFAINNHMYFKDFFGEDYVKDILENNPKFQNVQELTKRMTVALAKGITPESPAYADMYDIVDGKAQIPCIIVYDSKLTQETDGIIEPHNKFLDRTLQTTGVQDQPIYARTGKKVSPIANIKPFIFHRDNKLGTFMAKMNFNRQPEARQAEIEKLTGGSGLVIYSSSAKYKGKRKVYDPASGEDPAAYRFNISPESIRILKHEHMKYLDEDGNPVVHREKMDRQLSYYMEAPFFQEFFKRADTEMQATLKDAFSSPEKFQKFLKEEVLRVDDTEPEDEYEAETREFNTTTEKILNEYGYTKSAAQLPMVKSYVQQAIHNYIVKRLTQPHITGGVFVMAGRPDWVKPILGEDRRNIVLGHHASYMKIDHLFKNNKITVEIDGKEMNASKLSNRGIVTLGDLFNKYPKASVLVGSDRAPIDDIGGIRAHRIVGIGPEGTGSSVYLHPEEMKYLGGADNDYDTMKIYMEQGKHWHDTLLNKYNNMDYNKQDNDSAEELVSSGKFTQMVKSVIPEDDTFIKDAPQGLASLYDNRSYIKSAKSMNNAKTSIGSLMSLDRILRTMMAHGTLKMRGDVSATQPTDTYEVSTKGDKRFSALVARLKDGRTIEEAYQQAKGAGKGQPSPKPGFKYWETYLGLWKQWAKENPDLIEELRKVSTGKKLVDSFAKTENNQARALTEILGTSQQSKPVVQGEEAQVRWRELSGDPQAVEFSKLFPTITKDNIKTATDLVSSKTGLNISKVGNTTGTESKALLARLLVSPETQGTSNVIYGHGVMRNGEWYFRDTNTKVMDYINANYKPGDKVYSVVCDTKKRNFATAEGILLEAGSTKQPTANIPVKDKSVSQIESYDAAIKIWKKAVVDAKQGGLPPWDKAKRFMVDQVFGKGTADKVFGVFNREKRTWDTPKSADYSNVQDLYGHIFGRNWAENQAWTPDEVQNAVNDYFKNGEHNRTQLEEIVSHIPKLDLSIFPDLDVNKLSKFYKDYNISAGALKSNSELFRKFIADPNYEPTDKEISDFATRHKVKEFTPTAENIKSAFTDFIMNDINTVVTKKIYNTLASRINPKLKEQLDSVLARLFTINKAIQEREYQGKSLTQKELTELSTKRETLLGGINASLDKYKNPVLDDYVGIHFIGSVWNPKYPVFQDHSSKFGWQRWMGSNLMQSYVTQVNSKYNSILKTSAKKPTVQPTPTVQTTAVPGVQPSAIPNKPISAARRQKMLEAEVNEQISKLNLKPDKETQIWINKAQRALVDFGKEATGVWDILQFVKSSIHRPTEHQYDFDRYPMTKEEAKKLFFDAYRTAAGLRTWHKIGDRTMYINALYKMSTPETLSQAFPETKDWFKQMVDQHIIGENHLVEFNGAMNDIVAEAKEMGGTELIGRVAYDMRIDKLDDATIAKKYPELSRDDILKVRNNIAPKLTELFKLIKPVLESGFEYMKKNMENTWRAHGMSQPWINKQLSEMTLGNIEDYWPGYVTDMEYFAGQKAEQMAQDIINGTMQPGQLSDGFANVKRRDKDRAMPYQKDLEKVLNTYISSVVQWNKRQHIKYHSTQFLKNMSDKAASLSGPNKDMYDQALIYFGKLSDHVNKHKDPTIGDNLTNALMSLSFIKNIVGSVSSATKNYTQQLPGAINAGLVGKWSRDDLMKHQFNAVDEFGVKITGEKILHDATAKAGLTYAQTQGETGEKIDRPDVVMKAMKLAAEYEQDKGAKRKIWGLEKSRELANLLSEFANTGAEGKVKIKGKERKYQFGWMSFKGAETSNRSLTFQRAFSRKFGFWYDYYRKYSKLAEKDIIELAKNKAMRAGVDVVQLTQFDYHGYNTPEILRKEGFKGNSLKLALQFSKYTVGLYRMYKQMLLDATAEAKYSSGKAKILNESAGKLASIMATHAGLMILGNWWGLELYNYVQEDKLSSIRDLFYWAYGKVTDNMDTIEPKLGFYAQKEGPIPYLLGPTFGPLVSMGMMGIDEMTGNSGEGGLTDFTWNEWMQKDVYPRGPKKLINLVQQLNKKNPIGILNFFGVYRTPRKSKN